MYKNIAQELSLGIIKEVQVIQSLWGDYGQLVRLVFENNSIIVKHVKLPRKSSHPKGWNTNLSHQRKLHSYEVEVNWYENFSKDIDEFCRIPKGLKTFKTQNEWLIVMEDLAQSDFTSIVKEANENHIKTSLSWLANFHAKYLGVKSDKLWETGTYWHFDTRPDELEVLDDIELKSYARRIDEELKNSSYQTLVHGDAKLANFCYSKDGLACAAVDFQYVGHGCGIKDLILFVSSAVDFDKASSKEKWILDTYFKALKKALIIYHPSIDANEVEKQWRPLYCVAWADFQRFIKGWSPKHFKINAYTEELTLQAIEYLKGK